MKGADRVRSSTAVDPRIEARMAELAARIRAILQDRAAARQGDVDRAMSELIPELQRLAEYIEAAGGPRFVRVCERCGRLDLRVRWRTMTEAEEAVGAAEASWACRWCEGWEFVVLEVRDAVGLSHRGPRSLER